ncbi:DUF402 domain-containing protein [Actinoplanes sp. NPDC049118]|uniref:DUF402 domain-containing protein n=1 Tax=Actinoplanes sp. NPDC049118 TaxID=3155769 RepID=UPI0034089B15
MTFDPGQPVVRRYLHADRRIAAAQAALVVADDADGLLLWSDIGAETMRRTDLSGGPTRHLSIAAEVAMPTMLSPSHHRGFRTLLLMPPGAAHSVSWNWLADGTFAGWYVNLETPARRWSGGVDTRDQSLDVLVGADRAWLLKDEDDLAALDPAEAAAVRAECVRVTGLIDAAAFPFDDSRRGFRPPAGWIPATLPAWWDAVPA